MKTFLNISICLDSDQPFDILFPDLKERLEYFLDEEKALVLGISWDRDQALASVKASNGPIENLSPEAPEHSASVVARLEQYNLTLPKPKRGEPDWRSVDVYGEINGLSTLRGRIILTNGIKAILIVGYESEKPKWADVHWDSFVPDDLNECPADLPTPGTKKKKEVVIESLAGFDFEP